MMEVMTGMDSDERLWEARLVADVRAGVRLAENELYAYCADDQVFDGTPSEGHSSALPGDTLSADTIGFDPN